MRDLPFCDGPPPAAPFAPPEFVEARSDLHAGVVCRKQPARALPAANSARPSSDRTGSAYPRILILPAIVRVPPSCRQGCGPCPQASSAPSNGRREIGNACFRVPANFDSGARTAGDIPLVGLRAPHGTARHHFAVFGRCSVGLFALALGARVLQLRPLAIRRCSQMNRL